MRATISVTRPATLNGQRRIVSDWASRQNDIRVARPSRVSVSQWPAVWIGIRNWLVVALLHAVRSEARRRLCPYQVLSLSAGAMDLLVERLGQPSQVGHDEGGCRQASMPTK